jgi:hypothetical protein
VTQLCVRNLILESARLRNLCFVDAIFHSMSCMKDEADSSKTKPFCFVEFYEHAQASAAYATYHCTVAGAALSSTHDGAELTVDWANPLRLYMHMHGSMTRQPQHLLPRYRHVPQHQPVCGPAVQQQMSQEAHSLMRQQLPLPPLPPTLTGRTSRSFNSNSSSNSCSNSRSSNSSSFFSSNNFSEPQPRHRRLQLPPIGTRFCDLSSPSILELKRVWPHVRAQNSDYLARYGLRT